MILIMGTLLNNNATNSGNWNDECYQEDNNIHYFLKDSVCYKSIPPNFLLLCAL